MYAMKNGYDVDASKELVSLGAANFSGGLFLSFPVMGAFGRSAVNAATGARSQMSLFVSGITVGLLLLAITPVLYFLPKPVLGAIVMAAVGGLVDVAGALHLYRTDRYDLANMAVSFIATLFLGVEMGILAAMGFSLLNFIYIRWVGGRVSSFVFLFLPFFFFLREASRHAFLFSPSSHCCVVCVVCVHRSQHTSSCCTTRPRAWHH